MASNSRESWLDAAYDIFNSEGLAAVRIEPIARQIGATKGSFYWHFPNRAALVEAVMQRWEQSETDRIIDLAEPKSSAHERLVTVFNLVGERMAERGGEVTLYSEAHDEKVADVVERVTGRRIAYVSAILTELGFVDADRRAEIAVSAAIGFQQLIAGGWHPEDGNEFVEVLLRMSLAK